MAEDFTPAQLEEAEGVIEELLKEQTDATTQTTSALADTPEPTARETGGAVPATVAEGVTGAAGPAFPASAEAEPDNAPAPTDVAAASADPAPEADESVEQAPAVTEYIYNHF